MPLSPEGAAPAPGSVDCHAHVFGPAALFPYAAERGYTPPDAPCAAYLAMLAATGMDRGVLVQGSAHGLDNRAMLGALDEAPDRLRGIAVMPADTPLDALLALRRRNVVGLRFFSDRDGRYQGSVSLAAAVRHAAVLHRSGMHVQLMASLQDIDETAIAAFARLGMPVVVDHFGHVDTQAGTDHRAFQRLCEWVARGQVWVKLSAIYRLGGGENEGAAVRPFHDALLAANGERLLWGSDWPHPNHAGPAPDALSLLRRFLAWTPDAAMRQRILVANPAALFDF
jgi:predicted TIM-barrel fold metal-dependent hydrolase